jgi:hypothetical protein
LFSKENYSTLWEKNIIGAAYFAPVRHCHCWEAGKAKKLLKTMPSTVGHKAEKFKMKGVDGLEALRTVKEKYPRTVVRLCQFGRGH